MVKTISPAVGLLSVLAACPPAAAAASGCSALTLAGLGSLLLYPGTTEYSAREASYWSTAARLGPECIAQPRNTQDVSNIVKSLAASGANFAVRSGGHTQWAGGSNVHNGVTVDLGLMRNVAYNSQTKVASYQPGRNWGELYDALDPLGVTVTGGRDADVGIGGFMTGGGNSFYTARTGFAIDTVINAEVVLADGSIVNANASGPFADLHKALKGGWANFGIVTRFDVETVPSGLLYGGMSVHNKSTAAQFSTALYNFNNNLSQNKDDAMVILALYNAIVPGDTAIAGLQINTKNVVNSTAFTELRAIPAISRDIRGDRTLREVTTTYSTAGNVSNVWFSLTFNNDVAIINKAFALHDAMIEKLKASIGPLAFSTQNILQPIPAFFADIGAQKGGNMLGMNSVKTNSVLWLGIVATPNPADFATANAALASFSNELETFAKSRKGNVAWRYIAYVDKTQNPLKSYGTTNVKFMKAVAAKYDPCGVFQKQVPGSFKISTV